MFTMASDNSGSLKNTFYLGLWSSSVYLGAFLGPTIGGFLVDNFGFPNSTMYMLKNFTISFSQITFLNFPGLQLQQL